MSTEGAQHLTLCTQQYWQICLIYRGRIHGNLTIGQAIDRLRDAQESISPNNKLYDRITQLSSLIVGSAKAHTQESTSKVAEPYNNAG
jgi:hypothetical protein